jgi:hypothetical protein
MKLVFAVALIFLLAGSVSAQSRTVFAGVPSMKVSEGGVERIPEALERATALNHTCVISEIGGSYYWASRENTPLVRHEGGAFVTFIAPNGAGYVRVVNPKMKDAASLMSPTEKQFDYVEHLLMGLRSITYYGTVR